jgi:hypothetical protein
LSRPTPEFSRPVDLTTMKPKATMTVAAEPGERAALARRMGVEAIDRLTAAVTLEILPGNARLRLAGRLQAALQQLCVVTLEPVAASIDETFTVIYAGSAEEGAEVAIEGTGDAAGDLVGSDDAWDEPWPGDALDVGEAVAQQLALAIDPYPRAPGAVPEQAAPQSAAATRPFAALSSMVKDRQGRA